MLNTNDCDAVLKYSIMSKLDNVQYSNDIWSVASRQVQMVFLQNLSTLLITECMYYFPYVSVCFTHGYMPSDMTRTTIVPVIKNKCGNLADSNNYRPIAIATIVSKLYEPTILYKCEAFLKTCDNQSLDSDVNTVHSCVYTCIH